MGVATSVMPVIRPVFIQWVENTDWRIRCDWLQVASVVTCSWQVLTFIVVVMGV